MSNVIEFYSEECLHCKKMEAVVADLDIIKLEVWHNEENKAKFDAVKGKCSGVPFFYNEETGESLCGECSLEELKALMRS